MKSKLVQEIELEPVVIKVNPSGGDSLSDKVRASDRADLIRRINTVDL